MILYPSVVSKLFDDQELYERELAVYKAGLPHVPRLISFGRTQVINSEVWFISMRRIKGRSYLDQSNFSPSKLGEALAEFHKASLQNNGKCICHIDNQPQNIILAGTDFYFIDFSDNRIDFPEVDVSHLLLFWAEEYDYMDFISQADSLLTSYQKILMLDRKRWRKLVKLNIKTFDLRRAEYGKSPRKSSFSKQNRGWLYEVV